jgi:hypothetical protein
MQAVPMIHLAERVQAERRLRGWSIRTASTKGGISNQTWGIFERTGIVKDGMQAAVMQAFGWPATWSTEPPSLPLSQLDEMVARMGAQARALRAVLRVVRQLDEWGVDVSGLPGDDELIPPIAQ